MSLETVCAEIAAVAARPESGIAKAHNEPPETLGVYPTSWVNPVSGAITRGSEDAMWLHRIELIVYAAARASNLPVEFAKVAPLVTSVEAAFWRAFAQNELSAAIDHCLVTAYSIGIRDFGGKPQHAVTFTLDVKEHMV